MIEKQLNKSGLQEADIMKGFERKNQLFSLCGLNCGLCPMLLGNYCGGCGNGNQSCKIAKCSLEHGKILSYLLSNYNDGRRKTFFCVAVNLLELSEIQEAIKQIQFNDELSSLPFKEQCLYVVEVFQRIADRRNIKLKLIKKK